MVSVMVKEYINGIMEKFIMGNGKRIRCMSLQDTSMYGYTVHVKGLRRRRSLFAGSILAAATVWAGQRFFGAARAISQRCSFLA